MTRLLLCAVCLSWLHCNLSNPPVDPPDGDPAAFADAQAVLGRDCAFIGCHGREGMTFMLYALDFHRMRDPEGELDPTLPPLDERALSAAELERNRLAVAARVDPSNREVSIDRFKRRLLPIEKGGLPHADVVVYENENDQGLTAIMLFLNTVQ